MSIRTTRAATIVVAGVLLLLPRIVLALEIEEVRARRGESPPGNRFSPSPVVESDIVHFVLNADGITYGNDCFQGTKSIAVDDQTQIANVTITPLQPIDICTLEHDPVNGIEGEIGPLWPGSWTIQDSFGNALRFDVMALPLIPGDANGDGRVDAQDLNSVGINWQMDGKEWADGDFNGDSRVDASDLNILALNWLTDSDEVANGAVPEPGMKALVLVVFVAAAVRVCR